MSMSSQIITSDLLMDLSTEEQQFLSGGFSKDDGDDGDDDDKCKKDKSPSKIFIVKVYKKPSCCKPKSCCSH
ncbi:hypothetical protein [Nostoc sp. MG11]|uniref:hypothetical protein n=1 Tax=Nostoc sp. MG11 TaxID=2721166 RepID=UPI0018694DEB|nr:hypothetical protein [Nostoc sp. MG11]